MCCRRKQQGGWGLLACESRAVHRVEAIEGGTFDEFVDPPLGHPLRPPLQSCDCFIYNPIQQ